MIVVVDPEWYDDYDEGRIGLISYGTKNKNIRDIDWEDIYNHEGLTILKNRIK